MVGGKGCSLFQCLHFANVVLRNDVYVPHVVLDLPTYVYLHFHHTILVLLQKNMQCVQDLSLDKPVRVEDLITLCQLSDNNSPTKQFYTELRSHMLKMKEHLVISLLIVEGSTCSLKELFTLCQNTDTADVCTTCYSCVYITLKVQMWTIWGIHCTNCRSVLCQGWLCTILWLAEATGPLCN